VQVRCLLSQIRPDRQTLLFSATLPRKIERLVTDALNAPVRITVGQTGAANEDIQQHVEVGVLYHLHNAGRMIW
jgi:ATP-dependent RNA helicase DDX42